jgi:hypothetical protein
MQVTWCMLEIIAYQHNAVLACPCTNISWVQRLWTNTTEIKVS